MPEQLAEQTCERKIQESHKRNLATATQSLGPPLERCVVSAQDYAIWPVEKLDQTTERFLGCKQKLRQAVNDNLGTGETSRGDGLQAFSLVFPNSRS